MNRTLLLAGMALTLAAVTLRAQNSSGSSPASAADTYRSDRIVIQPKTSASLAELETFHSRLHSRALRTFHSIRNLQVIEVPAGETVESFVAKYQQSGLVEFAEPDYLVHAAATPNDPQFLDGTEWGLWNYGQNGGTPHADIAATNAWDILSSASNIVVAVLDSGIRATHEDLAANMWTNPVAGGNGIDAFTGTNNPSDGSGHGTLMAGVLGAVGNNGKGIAGVAWSVQMMNCRCLDNSGNGSDSDVILCMEFARTNGARIINASFSSTTPSLAVSNEILVLRSAGIPIITAAGNGSTGHPVVDVDLSPTYPACYKMDNIISVVATTISDTLFPLSNYGTNILMAAPGDHMYSTYNTGDSAYFPTTNLGISIGGTSFAAAYVSGACALLMAQYPADTYRDTIARLVNAVDVLPSLAGKCRTSGRLNLAKAIRSIRLATLPPTNSGAFQLHVANGMNRTCTVQASTNLKSWSPVYTNTASTNGTFDFADNQQTNLPLRFYRAVAAQ